MSDSALWRNQLAAYIRAEARPVDKYSHQPRLYALACQLAQAPEFAGVQPDDDILYAACWLHDLGVFIGHRPEDLAELAAWDNVAYAVARAPELLTTWGFPVAKIPAVQQAIAQHLPAAEPETLEALLLRVSDFVVRHADRIEEMDLNPVWLGAAGEGALPLDAVIVERVAAGGQP